MKIRQTDDTLGLPIECNYDEPNCLGPFTTILGGRDIEVLDRRYGLPPNIPFEPYDGGSVLVTGNNSVPTVPIIPSTAIQTVTQTATQNQNEQAETVDSNFVLIACAVVLGGILLFGGGKD